MPIEEKLYKQTAATDKLRVFTNPYALPLGFQAGNELKKLSITGLNPFDNQNFLIESISGVKDVLIPISQRLGNSNNLSFSGQSTQYYSFSRINPDNNSTTRVDFPIDKAQQVYLYFKAPANMKGSGFVTVNGKKVVFNPAHSTIINLGFCEAGTSPELQIDFDKSSDQTGTFGVYASSLNIPAFEQAVSLIREKSMVVEGFTDTSIRGQIKAPSDGLMVMSIPFDKGWKVKVDDQEVKTQAVDDCLLSFELSKGSHRVELVFFPDKFFMGIMITLLSFLMLTLLYIKKSGILVSANKYLRRGVNING
jgi:uncharacterized membrane protein YfhO